MLRWEKNLMKIKSVIRSATIFTLLALITPALDVVIFRDIALKRPALYVCLWEFDREHLKNNANKGRR